VTATIAILFALTVEAGAGVAASTERQGDLRAAPAVSLRLAHEASFWSAGLRGLLILGPEGADLNGGPAIPHNAGFRAWAALAEIGARYSVLALRVGAGIGQLIRIQCDCREMPSLAGEVAPMVAATLAASIGLRSPWRAGLEIGGLLFTGVGHAPGSAFGYTPPESGLIHPAAIAVLTLAWSGP